MPRNRRNVPREERVAEIVRAARQRFTTDGFRATSVADIARDVGIASGAVHWYFPSKDDLFAATLRDVVGEGLAAFDHELTDDDPQALLVQWITDREPFRLLHHDAHDRLLHSEAVAEAHGEMHRSLDALLLGAVRRRLPHDADLSLVADAAHYMLEGMLSTPRQGRDIGEIIAFAVDALHAAAASRSSITDPRS